MFNKIIRWLFIRIDLYCNDLQKINLFEENNINDYSFLIVKDVSELSLLQFLIDERGEKFKKLAKERLQSGNFICFCFVEKTSSKAAYSRWLRKDSFYHDRFRETIQLADDEAFTMDSYTPVAFRAQGLHKEMNKRMLNYCKKKLTIKKIYMIILRGKEYAHLHKTIQEIGYKCIRSHFYIKSDFFKSIINKIKKQNVQVS